MWFRISSYIHVDISFIQGGDTRGMLPPSTQLAVQVGQNLYHKHFTLCTRGPRLLPQSPLLTVHSCSFPNSKFLIQVNIYPGNEDTPLKNGHFYLSYLKHWQQRDSQCMVHWLLLNELCYGVHKFNQ